MKHDLSEDECTLGHMDPADPGQCRWCSGCIQYIRPKDFMGPCLGPCSYIEHKEYL